MKNYQIFIDLIKKEVVPALGCTEPIAVALATSEAYSFMKGEEIKKIEVEVSANILKNGMGVGIPGTNEVGLYVAAALGAIGGDPKEKLEVLKSTTEEDLKKANKLIEEGKVKISAVENCDKVFVRAKVETVNGNIGEAIIKHIHSNICFVRFNDKIIFNKEEEVKSTDNSSVFNPSIDEIYDFIINCPIEDIKFLLEGAKMNKKVAEEGLSKDYGLKVGKTIMKNIENGVLGNSIETYSMMLTSAASDARMAGCKLPVMSNSGSGNQGIAVMMPVVATAEKLKVGDEKLIRALALANLVAIHIKTYLGRLSALCGCVVASTGASCGITYLLDGDLDTIKRAIKNMTGNIVGMICDGAKCGCALKVSTGVSAAIQASLLALDDIEISCKDGIIDKDVENTIKNVAKIGTKGMEETDKVILDIMVCK